MKRFLLVVLVVFVVGLTNVRVLEYAQMSYNNAVWHVLSTQSWSEDAIAGFQVVVLNGGVDAAISMPADTPRDWVDVKPPVRDANWTPVVPHE